MVKKIQTKHQLPQAPWVFSEGSLRVRHEEEARSKKNKKLELYGPCLRATMAGVMVVIVQYTVFQRSPINQWSAGTTIVETSAPYSFNDLATAIEKHMKLQAGALMPFNFIGIFENKLVADKSSVLSRTEGPVQVCIAERSAVMMQQFPATA